MMDAPEGTQEGYIPQPLNVGGQPVTKTAPKSPLAVALAGLQAGMVGVLWMLAWLGLSAAWQKDSFWKPENLFATAFYGGEAYQSGFVHTTYAGLSLYLLIYSLLGAFFALSARGRLRAGATLLAAVLFGAAWYYATFRLLWRSVIPLAYLWHAETPTLIGHLIFGTFLARFDVYLRDPKPAQTVPPAAAPPGTSGLETPTVEIPALDGQSSSAPAQDANAELPVTVPAPADPDSPPGDTMPAPDRSSSPPDLV